MVMMEGEGKETVCCLVSRQAGLTGNVPLSPGGCATITRQLTTVPETTTASRMNTATLSPTSPKVKRKQSGRSRPRAPSHIAPQQTQETHDAALYSIRAFLRSRTSYDAFPVSFRLIVLDSQLEVKKALQCLLLNGGYTSDLASHQKRLTFLS